MTPADAELTWDPGRATDIALVLGRLQHGRADPSHRTTPDGVVWRTVRTRSGAATTAIDQDGPTVRCRAWGPGAELAAAAAPVLLGSRDDLTGFVPRHPLLESAHHRFPGLLLARTDDVFRELVGAVLGQRVEGVDANAAWCRLLVRLGEPAPGPAPEGMRVLPGARAWLELPSWEWRRAGVDTRRAATVQGAARVHDGLQRLAGRPSAEVDRALRTVRGVGAWTAAEVRQKALGDADAVSVGDLHLAAVTGQALEGRPFDDAEMVAYLEPWRPHRHRVARLLYALGIETLPRRAPRPRRGP